MAPKTSAQKSTRYLIIEALATNGPLTQSELIDRIPRLSASQIKTNVAAAKQASYVKTSRDDVTGMQLVTLTPFGRKWWKDNQGGDKDAATKGAPAQEEQAVGDLIEDQSAIIAEQLKELDRLRGQLKASDEIAYDLGAKMAGICAVLADYAPSAVSSRNAMSVTCIMDQLIHVQLAHIAKQESELIDLRSQVEILQQAHDSEQAARLHYSDETHRFRQLLDNAKYVVRAPRRNPVFAVKEANARRAAAAAVRAGVNAQIFTLIPFARATRGVKFNTPN